MSDGKNRFFILESKSHSGKFNPKNKSKCQFRYQEIPRFSIWQEKEAVAKGNVGMFDNSLFDNSNGFSSMLFWTTFY
jgi:hypothetical protein